MTRDSQAKQTGYVRLHDDFRKSFNWKASGVTRDEFREWARKKSEYPIRIGKHKWRPMLDGRPVRFEMVEAFSEYISVALKLGRYLVSAIALPCEPEREAQGETTVREPYAWKLGWTEMLAVIARNFSVPEEAYCQNEADIALAALMVVRWVGEQTDHSLSGPAAIALGEQVMRRTVDDYAEWMLRLWKTNENTVLFTMQQEGHELLRIGLTVSAPLKEECYQRFRRGEAEDSDIGPHDLSLTSKYLLHDAAVENRELDVRRAKASRSMSLARTVQFQMASLWPPLHKGSTNPRVITFAGTPESQKRLRAYSFRETGTKTRLTGKAVMELAPPSLKTSGRDYARDLAQYLAMKAIGLIYQASISGQKMLLEE